MKRPAYALLAFAVILATSCSASTAGLEYGQEEMVILEVAAERVPCVGEMEDMCLQVRSPGEEEWQKFYADIEGFEHEAGVRYTLEVGRREILNPPADGSAYSYRLIRILEEEEVGG